MLFYFRAFYLAILHNRYFQWNGIVEIEGLVRKTEKVLNLSFRNPSYWYFAEIDVSVQWKYDCD